MLLKIYVPEKFPDEKRYTIDLVFDWFLGIDFSIEPHPEDQYKIVWDDLEITFPDIFFSSIYRKEKLEYDKFLADPPVHLSPGDDSSLDKLPSWFHTQRNIAGDLSEFVNSDAINGNILNSPVDIFGTIFFLITRYEETVQTERDAHGRFPVKNSVLYPDKLYKRPLVNEYLLVLKQIFSRHGSGVNFKEYQFRQLLTCDLDYLSYPSQAGTFRKLLYFTAQLKKTRSVQKFLSDIGSFFKSRFSGYKFDRFNTFQILADRSNETGSEFILFLMDNEGATSMDGDYSLGDPRLNQAIQSFSNLEIFSVGLHGSYTSFDDSDKLATQKEAIELFLKRKKSNLQLEYSRQHYLRWDNLLTPQAVASANFKYDSTLTFAETSGFRASCCLPYPVFDLANREPLPLIEVPLVLMDGSLLNRKYLGIETVNEALDYAWELKYQCMKHHGVFNLLWHNSSLQTDGEREIFDGITATSR